ncbi:TIGR03013 family XrtA/PEP-CTERM system glycosyltransferase [Pleionea litopenaei]|uniref:TIGR03013 family PEP-CTERM/XrtA system glycosyltransferase n=1 Tax=Pleionea litopenaei TaxID=3070815 RepID=A0AA51RUS8_9GAMM|nr:TIGR03013 family XrtA/PEP-CTERM system glycosyltransferase [Pleionea sp. HL-JVS1]WMS87987.1 TIGR03013 family PEP-CTERM/XrtA system glycosyltransferase [Pleionea sp. HL-JVS1]
MVRLFGHYIPRALFLLLGLEFIVLFASVYIAADIRFPNPSSSPELFNNFNWKCSIFAIIHIVVMIGVGLYQRSTRDSFSSVVSRLFWSVVIAFIMLSILFYLIPELVIGRGVFVLSLGIGFGFLLIVRYGFSVIADKELFQSRVLVLGTGRRAKQLLRLKRKSDWRGLKLVGFVHLKGDQDHIEDESLIIRSEEPLSKMIERYGIDELIIAVDDTRKNYPVNEIIQLKLSGLRITDITLFFERQTGRMEIDTLSPNQVIFFEGFHTDYFREAVKRIFDIVVSLTFLIVSIPIAAVLYVLIKRESKWREPVIYSQIRTGQNGEPFVIYKFRSMVVDAEKDGPQYAAKQDARVTRVGEIMRKTRLDEIPQMWNVLKGDMSFVGPRPERPEFVADLNEKVAYYNMRHRVKPGITGWAQICYPYGDNDEDSKQKLQFDLYYIKNFSLFLDLTILLQTLQVIVWQKGSR